MLGGTLLICQGENAGIHEVSTHPEHRGKGYGKALMHKAFTLATAKGCKYATLQGKNDFADVIQIEMVRWRDFLACLMNL